MSLLAILTNHYREQVHSYIFLLCVYQIAGNKKPTLRSVF
ncbi:hypothetical protein EMIT0215P_40257 [Pseudomonas serboccidentalis]